MVTRSEDPEATEQFEFKELMPVRYVPLTPPRKKDESD